MLHCTGSQDNGIRVFKVGPPGEAGVSPRPPPAVDLLCHTREAHPADVNCVRWNPKQTRLLASAGDDNSIRLWRMPPLDAG